MSALNPGHTRRPEFSHLLEVSHTKKAILKYRFEEDLAAIEGDAPQLRQIRPDVPTVLLSGYSEKQIKEPVEDLDFAGFLKKPIGSREILDKVRTVLELT